MYRDIKILDGDILVHAGDILARGRLEELCDFNDWLGELPHKYKVVIAGNHDWCFERNNKESREILTNAVYLEEESVQIEGVNFYGTPYQPEFFNWAFNVPRGEELSKHWRKTPSDVDVLITHTPPYGILDQCPDGSQVGCDDLNKEFGRIHPKFHIFGHIHHSYGRKKVGGCEYLNAAICTERYQPLNEPLVFEIGG